MRRTNPDSLRSCICFKVFPVEFSFHFFNLLLARSHQAEVIIVKHLIPDAATRLGWELNHLPCDHGRRKNDASNYCMRHAADVIILPK